MATLQVKGMDDDLYRALSARASMDNRSISQEVVAIIQDALSRPPADNEAATLGFLEMIGTWEDDRSADEIIRDIRKNRRSGRRAREIERVFD